MHNNHIVVMSVVEQCLKVVAGHHGKSPWQWECREDPGQHESPATGQYNLSSLWREILLLSCPF